MEDAKVLVWQNLSVQFVKPYGIIEAVRHVSLSLHKGEILVLAGESGSGKTVLCRSVLQLMHPSARITSGCIRYHDKNILDYTEKKLRSLRGVSIGMVFQNPMTTLNPSMSMGMQLREAISRRKGKLGRQEMDEEAGRLLEMVGIPDGCQRLSLLPGAFSGGQRQRCAIAIALAMEPDVLLADEPTTALDVTVQMDILDLLMDIRHKTGMSILFVTHDLGVAAHIADRVAIMYAGKIVEIGTADEVFYHPCHPYTWGLLQALPGQTAKGEPLLAIPGMPPDMTNVPHGDAFAERNRYALAIDYEQEPPLFTVSPTHQAATWLLDKRAPQIEVPYAVKRRKT
jgi:oligopeptide transport system ATP-binding protein